MAEPNASHEPTPIQMVEELHRVVFGDTWARPESPAVVWAMLLDRVLQMTQGACGQCIRRERDWSHLDRAPWVQ